MNNVKLDWFTQDESFPFFIQYIVAGCDIIEMIDSLGL